MNRPLDGIQILDFSHILAGPFSTSLLGDLGADVIKIEKPPGGDTTRQNGPPFKNGQSAFYQCVNRNKKSLVLDLKTKEGIEIALKLASKSDVIVENFRPGVMEKLGLGYEAIKKVNKSVIYSSMTAFGDIGPSKDLPGFELILQAMTGIINLHSSTDGTPRKIQPQMVDLGTGALMSTGIIAALYHREKTGQGQWVKGNLLHSTVIMLTNFMSKYFMDGSVPEKGLDTRSSHLTPSQAYKALDGYFVVVAPGSVWPRFCAAVGRNNWIEHPQYSNDAWRLEHQRDLEEEIQEITGKENVEFWINRFSKHDVPVSPINKIEDFVTHPQCEALGLFKKIKHPVIGTSIQIKPPWTFTKTPCDDMTPPPILGENSDDVLEKYGAYNKKEIYNFKKDKIVF
jgi:glutaryl-CoA transferase